MRRLLIALVFLCSPAMAEDNTGILRTALESGDFTNIEASLQTAQKSYEAGKIGDKELMRIVKQDEPFAYPGYEQQYDLWVASHPQSYVARYMRARYFYDRAFELRGGAWARDTTPQQMKGFQAYLDKASADLVVAKTLSPKPILAIAKQVQVAAKRGEAGSLKKLLDEANTIDPKNIVVRENILNELVPRWGGSYEQMASFIESQKKFGLSKELIGYFESIAYADMGGFAASNERYTDAAAFYKEASDRLMAYDPKDKSHFADYVRSIYRKSLAEGHEGREPEIRKGLDYLLADDSYARRGGFYGIRADHKVRHDGDLVGAWADFQKGAELKDPFSLYKVGSTYCQGATGIVDVDRPRCEAILKEAAALGNEEAIEAMRRWGIKTLIYTPNLDAKAFLPNKNPVSEMVLVDVNGAVSADDLAALTAQLGKKITTPIRSIAVQQNLDAAYNSDRQKHHAESIGYLDGIYVQQAPDAHYVVLVKEDIYFSKDSFVFAWTLPHERRTILSVKRLAVGVTPELYRGRISKLVLRGAGLVNRLHSSGCVMGYAGDWSELDALSSDYCAEDMDSLSKNGGVAVASDAVKPSATTPESTAHDASNDDLYLYVGIAAVLVLGLLVFLIAADRHRQRRDK